MQAAIAVVVVPGHQVRYVRVLFLLDVVETAGRREEGTGVVYVVVPYSYTAGLPNFILSRLGPSPRV